MSKTKIERLANILGVKNNEEWTIQDECGKQKDSLYRIRDGFREKKFGTIWENSNNELELAALIENPSVIVHIRMPLLIEQELNICRILGAKFVTRCEYCKFVSLWADEPYLNNNGIFTSTNGKIADIDINMFPSVKEGDCIDVEQARKEANS